MNTLVNRILNTAISVTIGSIILVSGFWIADRLEPNYGQLTCEDNSLSDFSYLIAMGMVSAIGIVYQFTIAWWLRDKIKLNKFLESLIEIIAFVGCYTVWMVFPALIKREDIVPGEFLMGVVLGSVYTVSRLLFGKMIK